MRFDAVVRRNKSYVVVQCCDASYGAVGKDTVHKTVIISVI